MSSEDLPCVLFVSCSDVEKLMKLVNPSDDDRSVWEIDTKYYEARVRLVHVLVSELGNLSCEDLASAGGLVLYYDGNFEKSSDFLKTAAEKLVDCDAGVKLLVCDSGTEGSRVLAEEWCVDQGFEHLELEGPEGDEPRLKQALEAHVWPNLVPKDSKKDKNKKKSEATEESSSVDVDDEFSELFQHLATMKEQAMGLPSEERKNFAEQVVLAYWRSIGGDEDELLDV